MGPEFSSSGIFLPPPPLSWRRLEWILCIDDEPTIEVEGRPWHSTEQQPMYGSRGYGILMFSHFRSSRFIFLLEKLMPD
ncbi:hypothetical protein Bca52824_060572 [Brassica carinata]|uniref:Uncharacterized protein n=1 Tax=Brassica carinata TaxID=52824 RepID=A0A8X7QXS8_BRACI|nr:hypothetical protein Bca52824_060572 [Brassica carinata]